MNIPQAIRNIEVGHTIKVYEWRNSKTLKAKITKGTHWNEDFDCWAVNVDFHACNEKEYMHYDGETEWFAVWNEDFDCWDSGEGVGLSSLLLTCV